MCLGILKERSLTFVQDRLVVSNQQKTLWMQHLKNGKKSGEIYNPMGIEGTKPDLCVIGLRSPIQFVDPVSRLHSRWLTALHPHHEIPMRKTQFEGKSDKIGR
jgi:hypothetical protein